MIENHRWQRVASYVTMMLCALGAALYLGQDMNWDQVNYHVYAGYSAVEGRLNLDYFAASTQSYLNPYSHAPLYLMIKHDLAPQVIVGALALVHALTLLLVYETAIVLNRRRNGQVAWVAVGLAVLFAFFNPVFLTELGNTFNEISTGVLVLAGWYILVRQFDRLRAAPVALAGLLIGIAVALKLSNLLFAVTALPLLLMASPAWKTRIQAVAIFALGGLVGTALAGGWWAWQLWKMFGNPFFPLFNNIFHSPVMTDAALKHYRFVPETVGAFLLRPFEMGLPAQAIHVENVAPDLRYAALLLLLGLFALKYLLRRAPVKTWPASDPFPPFHGQRALAALGTAFGLAWVAWLASSGNSRYFLPMGSIAAVVLASLIVRFSNGWRYLVYGALTLVVVQIVTVSWAGELRWTPVAWGKHWFELDIPEPLREQPFLYFHTSTQSASFLLPFLAPGSSMTNLTGSWIVAENDATRALLRKYSGRTRVMLRVQEGVTPSAEAMQLGLVRFGLEADMDSCLMIEMRYRGPSFGPQHWHYFSCMTRPLQWSQERRDAYAAKMRRADALFDRLDLACPLHFQPRGLSTETDGSMFFRHYVNTDKVLVLEKNGAVGFFNEYTKSAPQSIGEIDALERPIVKPADWCR
jgi:hypothetical protein